MNASTDQAPTPAAPARPPNEVEHLFRHSLRQGRINPLMHVVLAYRAQEQAQKQAQP